MTETKKDVNSNTAPYDGLFLTDDKDTIVTRKDLGTEVESQVSKQIIKVATWVITALVFTIFGFIISHLWAINGDLHELKGKYSSPDNIIEHISARVETLEKENKILVDSLQKVEINNLKHQLSLANKKKGTKKKFKIK
jgi:hypothetical protein